MLGHWPSLATLSRGVLTTVTVTPLG
jgi:hypothetical protein